MTGKMLCALGVATQLLCGSGIVFADTVSFNPSTSDVGIGDTFAVNIVGNSFTELAGGTIDLGFDSSLLTIDSVTVNSTLFDFLPDGGGPAMGDTWPNIGFDTFVDDPASGNFTIATITLTSKSSGAARLSILGSSQFFSATAQLSPALVDGTVNVSAVPLPAVAWLFGSGLMGLLGISRYIKAA